MDVPEAGALAAAFQQQFVSKAGQHQHIEEQLTAAAAAAAGAPGGLEDLSGTQQQVALAAALLAGGHLVLPGAEVAAGAGPLAEYMRSTTSNIESKSSSRQLTSRFRGVCWNKKNKRWQAAINNSGRYLYLGSYSSQEEAASVFDKVALRLRGDKARLNFDIKLYKDEAGLFDDPAVDAMLAAANDPAKPKRAPSNKRKAVLDADAGDGGEGSEEGLGGGSEAASGEKKRKAARGKAPGRGRALGSGDDAGAGHRGMTLGLNLQGVLSGQPGSSNLLQQLQGAFGIGSEHNEGAVLGSLSAAAAASSTTVGTEEWRIDSIIPGDDAHMGVLYRMEGDSKYLAGLWENNASFQMLGIYGDEKEAKAAAQAYLKALLGLKAGGQQAQLATSAMHSGPLAMGLQSDPGFLAAMQAWGLPENQQSAGLPTDHGLAPIGEAPN